MNGFHRCILTGAAATLVSIAGSAYSAETDAAKTQYEQERARCMSGSTGQTQESCLKSAVAAYDASRQGRLNDPNDSFRANALSRCAALTGGDRSDCESRATLGTPQDAVRAGGDVKETVTVLPPGSMSK